MPKICMRNKCLQSLLSLALDGSKALANVAKFTGLLEIRIGKVTEFELAKQD